MSQTFEKMRKRKKDRYRLKYRKDRDVDLKKAGLLEPEKKKK